MKIIQERSGRALTLRLQGRLSAATAPQLEAELGRCLEGVQTLVLDLEGLEYISSAGLRLVLTAQKAMNRQGSMAVRHVRPLVMEVFEMTGFDHILTFQ